MTTPPPPPNDVAAPPPRRRARWGRRIVLALLLLVVLVVGAHGLWGFRTSSRLATLVEPMRAGGEPLTVGELNAWPDLRRPGENVVPVLREAAALVKVQTPAWRAAAELGADLRLPLRDDETSALDAMLSENADALAAAEAMAGKTGVDWQPAIRTPMMDWALSDAGLAASRQLAQVLYASALREHQRGNDAVALRRVEQLLLLSDAAGHGPSVISTLISLRTSMLAAMAAGGAGPELRVSESDVRGAAEGPASREQVRKLIGLLLDDRPLQAAQRRAWVGERVLQLDTMQALSDGKIAVNGIVAPPGQARPQPPPALHHLMRPYFRDNAYAMAAYTTDVMRANAEAPDLPAFEKKLGAAEAGKYRQSRVRYMMANVLVPNLGRAGSQHYHALADRRLAATVLACRLYALDHDGRLPEKLGDLVPNYLPAVPTDPLAAGGQPLRYVGPDRDPKKPRVYSVGGNGTDDGGNEPDATLPRSQREKVSDVVRYLARQPRPQPPPVIPETGPSDEADPGTTDSPDDAPAE